MDYDGNDTQGHNLELAGDGKSKTSSVLRPYAFPRFDFDDSLQGHLRFDSLVETEVFLGIQSQEENQWIEEFSRGSNVIEFSSSATEPCSITRRNNVWSEATSSESVEMLLKSVGQDQILPKDTVSENSNTFHELGDLIKKMEPKIEQDNVNVGDTRISDATMPQDELLNNFSGLENRVEGNLSQIDEVSLSQAHVVEKHQECRGSVAEGDTLLGTECDDKKEQEAECPVNESVGRTGEGLSHSSVAAQNINSSSSVLGSSQSLDQVSSHSLEGADASTKVAGDSIKEQLASKEMEGADIQIMEQHKCEDAMHTKGLPHSFALSAESVNKGTGVEVVINADESSAMSCAQESLPGKGQTELLSISTAMNAASTGNDSLEDNSEQHASKLDTLNAEHCSVSEPNMDSVLQLDQELSSDKVDNVIESSHKEGGSGNDVSGSLSKSSLIKGEDGYAVDKISTADVVNVGESLGFLVQSSSVELTRETVGAESIKDIHDASTVSEDISVQIKKEQNKKLCTDIIDKSSETRVVLSGDQRVGSSAMMESSSQDETIVNQLHSEIAGKIESGCNNEDLHKKCFVGESSQSDDKERCGDRIAMDASLSTLNESDHVAAEVGGDCEAQFGKGHDSTVSELSDTDGKLIPVVEACNVASASEPLTTNSIDCSKGVEVHPDCDDSVLNKGDVAEGLVSATDPQKVACGSPTIISSDVLTPDERKPEEVGGSAENKLSTCEEPKVNDTSGDDNSFTFKVNSLPDAEREKTKSWTPFPIAETYKSSVVLEKVAILDVDKIQARLPQEGHSPREHAQETPKTTSERKRRVSGKGMSKESSQKGVNAKEKTADKHSRKGVKFLSVPLSPGSSLPGQFAGLQPHGFKEQKSKKLATSTAVPTSNLTDMNASSLKNPATSSAPFQQPFTDLQQVQLRAQIFAYGSLIQGTAPEEAYMVSAFGSSDRGRGVWEPVWQAAVERVRSKKSRSSGESPMNSHSSGVKVPDVAGKQVSPQSKVLPSPVSQAGNKSTPTTTSNPIIPLSSPLWSITTPYHDGSQSINLQRRPILDYQPAVSPLHHYQTPPLRNIIPHTAWPSQAPSSPSPWPSQTSALNVNARLSTIPTEPVKLTPAKDFSVAAPPSVKDGISSPSVLTGGPSTVFVGSSQLSGQTKGTLSQELPSADRKPRRRKKAQASNDIPQNPLLSPARTEPKVASSFPASAPLIPVTIPTCLVTTSPTDVFPACSISQPLLGHLDSGMASTSSEETLQKVADAKQQAEEAATLAATAINHCQGLWSQLAKQDCVMTQEAELKISAAAGAAAAAASVAKAAAAAARVASNAALQAKLMADEALITIRMGDGAKSGNLVFNVQSVGKATPASILAGDGRSNQAGSVLVAAREAAKRRIEAASAAAKQAENLDAIVKAAELAAEAVSQAGKIVAMGDPLPLKQLINAGPEGYWKLPQASSELVLKSGNGNVEKANISSVDGALTSTKEYGGHSGAKGSEISAHGMMLPRELSNDSVDDNARNAYGISEPIGVGQKHPGVDKSHKVSDVVQSNTGLPVPGNGSGTETIQNEHEELGDLHGNDIKEGSVVEVYKDGDGLKPAWFSAKVLTLNDGKAFVHYNGLLSKEGSDDLKEWVALEGEGDKAPRIRIALPITALHWQATRKRRRSAMGNHAWTVGDMVDVSIHNSWWEGVVTEKNEKDETTLTVHFPARGETSAVSAQQLRPSRVWRDGKWVEWSRLRGHDNSNESDMPLEKRPRLRSPLRSSKGRTKFLEEAEPAAGKPEESKSLALSASEKVFNVGKSTKAERKPDARRTLRTGLQKEGSRVVFGVPKPGKKRKFMEVSKHFPAVPNRKDNEAKDPVKFAKYLIPQGATSRGLKNPSKVESKEKQAPKATTSRKPRSGSSRTLPQKDNLVNSASVQHDDALMLPGTGIEKSVVQEENMSKMAAMTGRGSSSGTDEAPEGPLSSLFANQLDSSLKKPPLSTKTELPNKGNIVPSAGQLTKIDEEKVYDSRADRAPGEVGEPRRSNRRIQPTHRLLEGLQSSLIIPKMSSVSHDKGQGNKSRARSALARGK